MAVSIESGLQATLGNAQLPAFPSLLQPISKRNAYTIIHKKEALAYQQNQYAKASFLRTRPKTKPLPNQ